MYFRNLFFSLLLMLPLFAANAQYDAKRGGRVVLGATQEAESTSFYVYDSVVVKSWYQDTTQAVHQYPEQLLISMLSADTQEWVNYNHLPGQAPQKSASHFASIRSMDTTDIYFELRHKFETTLNGLPTAFIKFYIHSAKKGKKICAIKTVQKVGDRWYFVNLTGQINTSLLIMRFQSDKMLNLLRGTTTGESLMDELISSTRSNTGALDFEELQASFEGWYDMNDQIRIGYFLDPTCW